MLTTVHFTCSDCAQTIEVNEEMRETILDAGCPVCTAAASNADFDVGEDDGSTDSEPPETGGTEPGADE